MEVLRRPLLDFSVASRPYAPGELPGDSCLAQVHSDAAIVALVDGVGHGSPALEAAQQAIALLEDSLREAPASVVRRCHEQLSATRGAVMSIAWFNGVNDTMTWIGVGNVDGVLLRARLHARPRMERLLPRAGVLGRRLPNCSASIVPVTRGDTLVLATDGVHPAFVRVLSCDEPPARLAGRIIAEHGIPGDDAMVVVARYRGTGG